MWMFKAWHRSKDLCPAFQRSENSETGHANNARQCRRHARPLMQYCYDPCFYEWSDGFRITHSRPVLHCKTPGMRRTFPPAKKYKDLARMQTEQI